MSVIYVRWGNALPVIAALWAGVFALPAWGASFDCAKAQSATEKFICSHPKISALDTVVGRDLEEVLSKANEVQARRVVAEQRNWIASMRNRCKDETCFRHAYWSRQAELETYFEPHSLPYAHEKDKAAAIKKILTTAPLKAVPYNKFDFCKRAFNDLRSMRGIRFIDPIVQVGSYTDPALDAWRHYEFGEPLSFEYACDPTLYPGIRQTISAECSGSYGLPPYKIFKLEKAGRSHKPVYIFYYDGQYGPMNQAWVKPSRSDSGAFRKLEPPVDKPKITFVPTGRPNYNSVIEYRGKYYLLTVARRGTPYYWVSLESAQMRSVDIRQNCRWVPEAR